jgi:hypothetical protein
MASRLTIAERGERLVYRIAGLPVAIGAAFPRGGHQGAGSLASIDAAFASCYWHPDGIADWAELLAALLLWPIALIGGAAWFTARNGRIIRERTGTGAGRQFLDQLRFYFGAGVLGPWYYIFSLHDDGAARARSFIQRFETKTCYFRLLKQRKGSPLNDKALFARFCEKHRVRCVPLVAYLDGDHPGRPLPDRDLFVKPAKGRGGRGAERWDCVGPSRFAGPDGELDATRLLDRLVERSRRQPLVVQPRLSPHPELLEITAGALPTVRVLTCLNREGEPEVMAAMLRTSFGANRTVDNLHAGGIGTLIELGSGTLSKASNLGADARLGWFSVHPDTGARIEGRALPCWSEVKERAVDAHRAFSDRVVIGWDISILEDGPIFIEGNGNPDLDILQRFMRIGLRRHRFAELLAYHLQQRSAGGA